MIPIFFELFHIEEGNKKAIYLFEFYLPGIVFILSKWVKNKEDMPLEDLADLIEGILKDGILSQLPGTPL